MLKNIFNAVKISGQAQVAKKSWTIKKFSIRCIFTWGWSV